MGLIRKKPTQIKSVLDDELGNFPDYTKKEIFRQGDLINALLDRYIRADKINFDYLKIKSDKIKRIYIVGDGIDYASAIFGAYNFEVLLDIISVAVPLGEFICSNPIIDKSTLVVLIGRNEIVEKRVADCNGKIIRLVDFGDDKRDIVLGYKTRGSFDTAVFSLKLVALSLLALYFGEKNKIITELYIKIAVTMIRGLKDKIAKILACEFTINELAGQLDFNRLCLTGSNVDYAVSVYGSRIFSTVSEECITAMPVAQLTSQQLDNCDIIALASSVELYNAISENLDCRLKIVADSIASLDKNMFYYDEAIPLLNPIQCTVILQLIAYEKYKTNSRDE